MLPGAREQLRSAPERTGARCRADTAAMPPRPLVVGLCGGIACGKSTLAALLARDARVSHVACDGITREAQRRPAVFEAIVGSFGEEVVADRSECMLDRSALGAITFRDPSKMAILESLVGPAYDEILRDRLDAARSSGFAVLLLEATDPTWFHCVDQELDFVWTVAAEPELQLARLMARNADLSEGDARARLAFQGDLGWLLEASDECIPNSGDLSSLEALAEALLDRLLRSEPL